MTKTIFFVIAFLGLGCANSPQGRAVQLVVASDAAADEVANGYDEFVESKVAECDEKLDPEVNTKADAKECLGVASSDDGERLKKVLETLVVIQLAVKLAVECESNPLKVPDEFRAKCVEGQEADWAALSSALMATWRDLAPFLNAVREHAGGK